jgi:leucyl-tRNA synthetase
MQLNEVEKTGDGDFRAPALPDLELEEVIEKMSKSRGNVLTPDDVIEEFGADSMRLYEMFIGPIEKAAPWSTDGMQGVRRFLDRTWRLLLNEDREGNETLREFASSPGENESRLLAKTIAGVTEDIEAMRFNTAISKLMVFVRDVGREPDLAKSSAEALVKLLSPFAPHIAEELWKRLDHGPTITYERWPEASAEHLIEETIVIVVQVNGKRRDEIVAAANASEEALKKAAIALDAVQKHLQGREPRKVIVVPGRLINVVG